jgi:S1-C subfamily serine protease
MSFMHRIISRRAMLRAGAAATVAAAALTIIPGATTHAQTPAPPTATPPAGKRSQKQRIMDSVVIVEVAAGSPAEKAGLKAGESITMIDGKPVAEQKDLAAVVAVKKPGDTLSLEVAAADGAKRSVSVTLADNPSKAGMAFLGIRYAGHGMRGRGRGGRYGFDTGPVTVADVQADSPASKAGAKAGDVITEANGIAVTGLMSLKRVLAGAKPGDTLTLKVTRGLASQTLTVTLGESPTQKGQAYLGLSVSLPRIQIDRGTSSNGTQG